MADDSKVKMRSSKAYPVFLAELKSCTERLDELISVDGSLNQSFVQEIRERLHKIKGGAGFFGLAELEKQAATFEEYLLRSASELQNTADSLLLLVREFVQSTEKVPPPTEL